MLLQALIAADDLLQPDFDSFMCTFRLKMYGSVKWIVNLHKRSLVALYEKILSPLEAAASSSTSRRNPRVVPSAAPRALRSGFYRSVEPSALAFN